MNGSDFLLGMFTVATVLMFAVVVYPAVMALVERLLKRKWGRR